MAKKVRRRNKSRRAKQARGDDRSWTEADAKMSRKELFLKRFDEAESRNNKLSTILGKYLLYRIKELTNWPGAGTSINTVKSWRNLRLESQQSFFEILISCSLPLPEITSHVRTYEEDDERAMRGDWESSAFDLYLATFYLFKYWRQQNNELLDGTTARQFRVFHAQMQDIYLRGRASTRLMGRVSRLEHL